MTNKPGVALSYEERTAISVLRKSIARKPEIIELLLRGQAEEVAVNALTTVRDELNAMLGVCRAFRVATADLIKKE